MDGFEAGQLVATFRPNVILLDLRLPQLDGFEVCRRIKENPETAGIHVICMTGFYTEAAAERIKSLGAVMLLEKPFNPDELRRAFAKVGFEVG
jgi:CheY-like chemotaxis protein